MKRHTSHISPDENAHDCLGTVDPPAKSLTVRWLKGFYEGNPTS